MLTVGSTVRTISSGLIDSNEYLVLCSSEADSALQDYGNVLVVSSFPSLANTEQTILLKNSNGEIISRVSYTDEWYKNDFKAEGGWSLEQIDPLNPIGFDMPLKNTGSFLNPSEALNNHGWMA